jgi:hypothetical protein
MFSILKGADPNKIVVESVFMLFGQVLKENR